MRSIRLCLFPTVEAPREARQGLAPLADEVDERSLADLRTVIGELVTISVAHGASKPIDMRIDLAGNVMEGVFYDDGPGTRALARAKAQKDSSLVLRIVDSLVDDWGPNPGQTRIWFRMGVRRA